VLVGIMVTISRGSVTQLVIGCVFSAVYLCIQMQVQPYADLGGARRTDPNAGERRFSAECSTLCRTQTTSSPMLAHLGWWSSLYAAWPALILMSTMI
jgi:hypothetical protein